MLLISLSVGQINGGEGEEAPQVLRLKAVALYSFGNDMVKGAQECYNLTVATVQAFRHQQPVGAIALA